MKWTGNWYEVRFKNSIDQKFIGSLVGVQRRRQYVRVYDIYDGYPNEEMFT